MDASTACTWTCADVRSGMYASRYRGHLLWVIRDREQRRLWHGAVDCERRIESDSLHGAQRELETLAAQLLPRGSRGAL